MRFDVRGEAFVAGKLTRNWRSIMTISELYRPFPCPSSLPPELQSRFESIARIFRSGVILARWIRSATKKCFANQALERHCSGLHSRLLRFTVKSHRCRFILKLLTMCQWIGVTIVFSQGCEYVLFPNRNLTLTVRQRLE
jgi:hypothetical protein